MFFKSLMALALLAVAGLAEAQAADPVGLRTIAADAPERTAPLTIDLWYPAGAGGTPVLVGDNAVFEGASAWRDAPIAGGPFPVILLSHGGLRSAPGLESWIAARLAARGFVVAVPQSPGAARLEAAEAPAEIWRRPAGLSVALTALERDPFLEGRIDLNRVGVLGFALGGTSALALAGARIDPGIYARSCDAEGSSLDCAWFRKNGVDLHKVDAAKLGRSNADPRIGRIVAIDPEYAGAFMAASLAEISIPAYIVNLGASGAVLPGTDAAGLAKEIPAARYDVLPDATPFDAFNTCKPKGRAILRDEGDDERMCIDGKAPRMEIQARLAELIAAAFERPWGTGL